MSGIKHPMSFLSGVFHENVKFSMNMFEKSSIPKCQELGIRYHLYIDFPWKRQKELDTQMSRIKHPMSFLSEFFHENVKKSSIPKCQKLSIPCQFFYEFFHENVKKSSIPKCHELSLRCHFYLGFPWKCQKKLDTQMSQIQHPMSVW